MIFYRKEYKQTIDQAVFPGLQGGPHQHQIAALATQLLEVRSPEFKAYSKQVKANARALADQLVNAGLKLVTDGTDNHLLLIDLKPHGLTGGKVQKLCDMVGITLNKNTIHGDSPALATGIRIGTPAMTTRGLLETDFITIGNMLIEVIGLGEKIMKDSVPITMSDWEISLEANKEEIDRIHQLVREFSSKFDMPGI
jgi:glycine hydroxymethyltransferase